MPEVILPCPACGGIAHSEDGHDGHHLVYWVECSACEMNGPMLRTNADAAISAWNALPRSLRWTHEPPKVAGWYWRKETAADRAHVFHFTGNWEDYGEHWESDRVCQLPLNLNGNLWAGPIAPPVE